MEQAARLAMEVRDQCRADGAYEAFAFVEIDCVNAFKLLMRQGSKRLRGALAKAALDQTVVLKAA
jgi:hypothetical protein